MSRVSHKPVIKTGVPVLMVLATFLGGCGSATRPSESEIQSQVEAVALSGAVANIATVENFKKVNGFEDPATHSYVAEVSYDLVVKKSYKDILKAANFNAMKSESQVSPEAVYAFRFAILHKEWDAGAHFPMTEKVPFRKTESGWRVAN